MMRTNPINDVAVRENDTLPDGPAENVEEIVRRAIGEAVEPLKQQVASLQQQIASQQQQIDFMSVRNFLGSDDLINCLPVEVKLIEECHWKNLIRKETPEIYRVVCSPFFASAGEGNDDDDCDYSVATANSASSGKQFSNENFPTVFQVYIPHAESAHLLSAGPTCWPYFAFAVIPFLGKDVYEKLKAWIENPDAELPEAKKKLFFGLINGIVEKGAQSKKRNTGLKNSIVNRIRLPLQEVYFDKKPWIMFLPILTLNDAREWNGEGYKAIFLVNTGAENAAYLPQIVSAAVGILDESHLWTLRKVAGTTDEDEMALFARACDFLKKMVLGLVYCTANFQPDKRLRPLLSRSEGSASTQSKPPRPNTLGNEQNDFLISAKRLREGKIDVPISTPDCEARLNKGTLLVVDFGNQAEAEDKKKPLAPDPMLLGMKSAVNYLRFHSSLRILPGCSPSDDVSADSISFGSSDFDLESMQHHFLPVDSNASVPGVVAVTPISEIDDDEFREPGLDDEESM